MIIYPLDMSANGEMLLAEHNPIIFCQVCGEQTRVSVDFGLMRQSKSLIRETLVCSNCKSWNRQRQISYVLCQIYEIFCLRELAISDLDIYLLHDRRGLQEAFFNDKSCHQSGELDLSWKDKSFDLIISSDLLGSLPDPYSVHREFYRILRKGGRHVFTVPFRADRFLDEKIEGSMVFSLEMMIRLAEIGFKPNFHKISSPWHGIYGNNALVFEAKKE